MSPVADRSSARKSPYSDIDVEMTQMVFRNILMTMVLAMIAVAGTTSILAHYYNDYKLWCFNIAMSSISLTRVAVIVAFNRQDPLSMTSRAANRWITIWSALTLISFTATGVFTIYNFSHHDSTGRVFSAVGGFIICSGLSGRLSARPRIDQAAGIIFIAALLWSVAHTGERFAWVVCLMLVMFAYGHCVAVQNRFEVTVEQLRSRRKLRALANHDALTGLANRRNFETALSRLCSQNVSFAVLFLDLDGFKKVNDTRGHAVGDILLEHVAKRLQSIVRESDLVARLGGDEFAILHAPDATRTTAANLAKRTINTISAPYVVEGHPVNVGTSIGIQLSSVEGSNDPDTLLSDADKALYKVKHTGKGNFRFTGLAEAEEARRNESGLKLLREQKGVTQMLRRSIALDEISEALLDRSDPA